MMVPAMVSRRDYDARSAIIVVVAVRRAIVWGSDADAHAARSRIDTNLGHRGGCRCREECRGRNDAECEFSHESLLSLLKQINAEACAVVPQVPESLKFRGTKMRRKFDGTNHCSRTACKEYLSTILKADTGFSKSHVEADLFRGDA
jgi:hypothetical protein